MNRAVFIASTYDEDSPLNKVFSEAKGITNTVNVLPGWKCQHVDRVGLNDIIEFFSKSSDSTYEVFHYAGHAIDQALQFNDGTSLMERMKVNMTYLVDVGGLAKIVRAAHPIQLAFLNGCSTKTQVEAFKAAGVPAVIYTNQPLNDELGKTFAKVFYFAFFEGKKSLKAAFDMAIGAIEVVKNNLGDQWLDPEIKAYMNRGIKGLDALPSQALYELDTSAEFQQMTWEDWPKPVQFSQNPVPKIEIPETVIHRCDRTDEMDEYHEFLEQLATKELSGPVFFFIHEKSQACPQSLVKRFELYGVGELCERAEKIDQNQFVWKMLNLPRKKELRQPGKCKSRMYEIYDDTLFKCRFDEVRADFFFEPNGHGDKVFVIHHDLTTYELEAADDLKPLMEFYLGEFSRKVQEELKANLAIVFSYLYFSEQPEFMSLFESLSTDAKYQGRVKNLTSMKPVSLRHVGAWRQRVFKDRLFPAPPDEQELFPFAEGERKPMREVQELLAQKLADYNLKIRTQDA